MTSEIPALLHAGHSVKRIASLANEGTLAFNDELQLQYALDVRTARRNLKAAKIRALEYSNARQADSVADGQYIRYIPERKFALAPIDSSMMPGSVAFSNQILGLRALGEVVGWAQASGCGIVASQDENDASPDFYAFSALACTPMPAFAGNDSLDGGCYAGIVKSVDAGESDSASGGASGGANGGANTEETQQSCEICLDCEEGCAQCARFGRPPTSKDLLLWNSNVTAQPHDRTLMVSDVTDLTWGDALGTLRPRLMPHMYHLPMNATACVLPAGTYLCIRCTQDEIQNTLRHVVGQVSALTHEKFSKYRRGAGAAVAAVAATADSKVSTSKTKTKNSKAKKTYRIEDPNLDGCIVGDASRFGWVHALKQSELSKLIVPTDMALYPKDGFVITCAPVPPKDRNERPFYEVQLFIDASQLDL